MSNLPTIDSTRYILLRQILLLPQQNQRSPFANDPINHLFLGFGDVLDVPVPDLVDASAFLSCPI